MKSDNNPIKWYVHCKAGDNMKKHYRQNKKFEKVVSIVLIIVLVFDLIPLDIIPDKNGYRIYCDAETFFAGLFFED